MPAVFPRERIRLAAEADGAPWGDGARQTFCAWLRAFYAAPLEQISKDVEILKNPMKAHNLSMV